MSNPLKIQDVTGAIDLGARDLWDSLDDDQKKSVTFYTLNRYISSVKTSNRSEQELAVFKANEYFNKNFFNISKHPKLLWHLACMCGNEQKKIYFHEWIGFKKKEGNDKIFKFLESKFPNMKLDEIEMMAKLVDKKGIKEFAKDLGLDDSEIKKLF